MSDQDKKETPWPSGWENMTPNEKIEAAGSYVVQKHIGALKELAKGPKED